METLAGGVVPSEGACEELVAMGLLEKGPTGYCMTLTAQLKLEALRIKREREALELWSADISHWANPRASDR